MLLTEFSQEFRSSVSCFQFSEIYKPLDRLDVEAGIKHGAVNRANAERASS